MTAHASTTGNAVGNAIRNGVRRGWTEFEQSVRSPQDQGFYIFTSLIVLAFLFFNRNNEVEGAGMTLTYPTVAMPSMLGAMIAFGMIIGPAYAIAMERGTGRCSGPRRSPTGCSARWSGTW
jgi:ABC-2 type transport system permease protein